MIIGGPRFTSDQHAPGLLRRLRLAPVALVAGLALLLFPTAAFAASGGSGAPDAPATNTGGSPAGQSILCTLPIPTAGGTIGCSNIEVTIPAGLPDGLEIVLSSGAAPQPAITPAITIGVYYISTGAKYTGTFNPPLTVVYTNSAVAAGEPVLVYVPATGTWVAPPSGFINTAVTSAGEVTVTINGDPTFYVPGSTIAGSTLALTGKPFLGEGIVASVLVLGGLVALAVIVRRRPGARPVVGDS